MPSTAIDLPEFDWWTHDTASSGTGVPVIAFTPGPPDPAGWHPSTDAELAEYETYWNTPGPDGRTRGERAP